MDTGPLALPSLPISERGKRKKQPSHGRKCVHSVNVARPAVEAFVTLFEELRKDGEKFPVTLE